ncbi:MAG: hypothetical protein V4760_11645, partial [Bdellovibrionota bacterium]
ATPIRIDGFESRTFLSLWLDPLLLGYKPVPELMVLIASRKLATQVHPGSFIYPYEEKCLEHALLAGAREGTSISTIGFAHAVHNKGHLYMRDRSAAGAAPPMPDKIATTGPTARDWLFSWGGHSASRLTIMGSPRHTSPLPAPDFSSPRWRALVIISAAHEL